MHGIINFLNHRPPKKGEGKIITSFGESNIGPRKQYHLRYGKNFGNFGNWQGMFTRHDNRGPVKGDIVDYNDLFNYHHPIYTNSANTVNLNLRIKQTHKVNIRIYDILGRHINTVFEGELTNG